MPLREESELNRDQECKGSGGFIENPRGNNIMADKGKVKGKRRHIARISAVI